MTLNQALISETTLNATAASVTIPVPSGYTDVRFVISARDASTTQYANDLQININGSSANISNTILYGNGAGVGSGNTTVWLSGVPGNSSTANTFSNVEVYISDYANASKPKAFTADGVTENNATNSMIILGSGLYNSNTPITSVTFNLYGGTNFTAGSSFTLYGISKLGVTPTLTPKATGGDIIKNDGTYWYHAFLSTGAFTPQTTLSCDVLQVAGGGGGGRWTGGGGGAGGILAFSAQSLTATSNPVTVGAGGAGGISGTAATSGSNSQFAALTASIGGGAGGNYDPTIAAKTGGSGGGGNSADPTNPAAGTSGQGYAGGAGIGAPWYNGGGGGGAGHVGYGSTGSSAGWGGEGVNTYTGWGTFSAVFTATSLGVSGYIAGGGAGGAYSGSGGTGVHGGGNGGADGVAGTAGKINTGGGGGGGGNNASGAAGGSGIVIIRYAMA